LANATWVGSQVFMFAAVVPALRPLGDEFSFERI
jgi:hypothetical protein